MNDINALRRERYQDIKQQLKKPFRPRYVYLLLEPDRDVIRYVGVCFKPEARFCQHAHIEKWSKPTNPRLGAWINSLNDRGELPRMLVVGKIGSFGFSYEQEICMSSLAEVVEREIIIRLTVGRWVGNTDMTADLLNVDFVPATT